MPDEQHRTSERLTGLEARVGGIENGMKDIVTAVSLLSNEIKQEGQRRAEQTANANKPQWGVLITGFGVTFGVLSTLGAAFYMPIRENTTELRMAVRDLDKSQVPRVEHEKIWNFQERIAGITLKRLERLEDDFYRRSKP